MKTTMKFKQVSVCLLALSLTSFVTGCIEKSPSSSTPSAPITSNQPSATQPSTPSPQSSPQQNSPLATIFQCVKSDEGRYMTVGVRPDNPDNVAVIFIWSTEEFGSRWSPYNRCTEVTSRLNKLVPISGRYLQSATLDVATISDQYVICIKRSSDEKCTNENMLVTLNKENAKSPREAMDKLILIAEGRVKIDALLESGSSFSSLESPSFSSFIDNAFKNRPIKPTTYSPVNPTNKSPI